MNLFNHDRISERISSVISCFAEYWFDVKFGKRADSFVLNAENCS